MNMERFIDVNRQFEEDFPPPYPDGNPFPNRKAEQFYLGVKYNYDRARSAYEKCLKRYGKRIEGKIVIENNVELNGKVFLHFCNDRIQSLVRSPSFPDK